MYHACNRWSKRYAYAVAQTEHPFFESRQHRGSSFGVRRPLRYLSYQLDLDDSQRRRIAAALDRLKIEREQGRLDKKKTVSALAELVTREGVSVDELRTALAPRIESAENLQIAIAQAVQEIAAVLDPDQREEFAHLIRSDALKL
ncbi:MAG: hypothetical protein VB948_10280 [Pseudomonadales bacterium]|jgi:Spy/CpxP family protein refolding chaperone